MARRKKSGGGGGGDPAWLITFSDLMTLLLTFFVLLLSMAVIDERAKLVVLGSVSRAFGSHEKIFNPLTDQSANRPVEPGPMDAPSEDLTPLRDMLIEDTNHDLNFQQNKFVQIFSINDEVLFLPGSTSLSPGGIALLDRILPYLQRIDYPLLVAGHTASRRDEEAAAYRLPGEIEGVDSTWSLSFNRALSVYQHLGMRGIDPGRLSLEAFGQYHPRYSNNNPEGRRKNRRVDLVLDRRNLEWIRKVEALQEKEVPKAETYFKGFKFDLTMPGAAGGGRP
ncbi:OmpA family protein [Desulfovibrio sp. OttesenSCG-928-M16]|nr:OmpA family protein [Desulfovibrio sp. OttesenSCG-928-M16]